MGGGGGGGGGGGCVPPNNCEQETGIYYKKPLAHQIKHLVCTPSLSASPSASTLHSLSGLWNVIVLCNI